MRGGALHLLGPRLTTLGRTLAPRRLRRNAAFLLVALGIWAGIHKGAAVALGFLHEAGPIGDLIALKLLGLVLFSLFWFILLSSIVSAVSAFYLARDLPLLMTRPVEPRALVAARAAEAIFEAAWMPLLFLPAIALAYGRAFDAPVSYYAAFAFTLVPFFLIPAAMGIALAHLLASLFPSRATRDALIGLGFLAFVALYFVVQSGRGPDAGSVEGLMNTLMGLRFEHALSPATWAAETVTPLLRGARPRALPPLLLAANAAMLLLVAHELGAALHARGLSAAAGRGERRGRAGKGFAPGRALAFYRKDMRVFFRDTEQWSQLVVVAALLVVYVFNIRALPLRALAGYSPFMPEILAMGNALMAGLVLAAVAARFLFVAVSLEGQAFWIARSAPVGTSLFLMNKFLYGFVPTALLMLVLAGVSAYLLPLSPLLVALTIATTLVLCVSLSGLATGMGAMYPRFSYESIAQVSIGAGSLTFMALGFGLVTLTVAIEAWAYFIYMTTYAWDAPLLLTLAGAGAAVLALNAAAFLLPMRLGLATLNSSSANAK